MASDSSFTSSKAVWIWII